VADDHAILREGIRLLLDEEEDFEVVEGVADGRSVVKACCEVPADIVVMDIAMPGLNGIEATRQITATQMAPRVVCLSVHADRQHVEGALQAGAFGYLLKECAGEELVRAIRVVVSGKKYISPVVADVVVSALTDSNESDASSAYTVLTAREREVLQLLSEGRTAKEVAGDLFVSVKTVNSHRENIMRKLDIHSVAELTKYAIREGITSA